jgi:two-component system, chemotaxis family, sensor kinase CheA
MDELLSEFLTETNENLDVIDVELVTLEKNPDNPGLIDNIFRLVHTIKGTCGFLGLPRLESVAHSAENILGKVRDGSMAATPEVISLVLEALDRIKGIMAELEANEAEPDGEDSELITRLDAMADGEEAPASAAPAAEPEVVEEALAAPPEKERELKSGEVSLEELERVFNETAGPVGEEPASEASEPEPEAAPEPEPEPEPVGAAAPPPPPKAPEPKKSGADKGGEQSVAAQTIRVNVDLLENLMNMVSELVLTRNQLLQMVRNQSDSEFTVPLQRLSHVTTDLQEGVMKTRMQPIGNAWAKLPRIIRDLAHELNKKIDLEMLGADTELDRQVLELIKDPLTHMVRNSADHGLESTADRVAAGKSEIGKVVLNAFHQGGHIIIQISDDGGGINTARVKEKAISNGIIGEAEAEGLTDQQIVRFIFKAGFSTAAEVTSVSGRGVGMDVVRTNIEKIGGTVDVKTEQGRGSTFTIKIPLTLAIVSALIVECGAERFAMPQISVAELVRASDDSEHRIESINGTPVLRLRNRLLPLVQLRDVLGVGDGTVSDSVAQNLGYENAAEREKADEEVDDPNLIFGGVSETIEDESDGEPEGDEDEITFVDLSKERDDNEAFIVVTQVGSSRFGIVVDKVFDTEEIVVKPVAPFLRDIKAYSGNTILGDGSVIMILDPNGIADLSGEISDEESDDADDAPASSKKFGEEQVALLVFRAGDEEPKAVPLSLIARLEEIDIDTIETSNGRMVVQYRGKLMPLVNFIEGHEMSEDGRQPILVFTDGERSMGLIVDEIIDIVEETLNIELASDMTGIIGSAIIAGKATGVIDTSHYLGLAFGDWFRVDSDGPFGSDNKQPSVLLVDDSAFFRNLLMPVLATAGYEVSTASDGNEALKYRDEGADFDIIVSDIEMPGLSGFEFAEQVRSEGSRWSNVPVIALSSHASPRDMERGHQVGFTDYVPKSDRDALLETLNQTLRQHTKEST